MTTQADHLRLIKIVPFPVHMDNIEITSTIVWGDLYGARV